MHTIKGKTFIWLAALIVLLVIGCSPAPTAAEPTAPAATEELVTAAPNFATTEEATEEATGEATEEATMEATEEATTEGELVEEEVEGTTAEAVMTDERTMAFGFILDQVLQANDLAVDLQNEEFTLFVPGEESVADIDTESLAAVSASAEAATAFFGCHIAPGAMSLEDLSEAGSVTTVNGMELVVTNDNGTLWINGEVQITGVLHTQNGYIFLIDGLLCDPTDS